ncbi:MAG: crotonase/enoyl-CoA hydratase family protein [Gammaproteobacteria bacterium]
MSDTLPHLSVALEGEVATLRIDRPEKRNAINDELIASLNTFFRAPPAEAKVVVLCGNGDHFSAGLDLAEHKERDALAVMHHSQFWHETFRLMEFGRLPIVAALHGGVIGGGLEIAMTAHVRVADRSAFYELPEGRRGIFVGGGASVRVVRAIGVDRVREMMLTGRRYDAGEGQQLGLSHYLVEPGEAFARAHELARTIAANAPASNYMMMHALPHIENMSMTEGLFTESLAAALAQTSEDAREGMRAFLEKRGTRFRS